MRKWFWLAFLILLPWPGLAATYAADLGIYSNSIFFSKKLIAGDKIRIYATIRNEGNEDVAGYVSFFQGDIPIGNSQIISVRAGGEPEEVYVDFLVPGGSFNIRAEIRGTDPQDENPKNDSAFTKLFVPILDDDRDGIENDKDNCPGVANKDQLNTDGDSLGDVCDDDDDGDGVSDSNDAYPLDPTRQTVPPPPEPEPIVAPAPEPTPVEEPTLLDSAIGLMQEAISSVTDSLSDTDDEEDRTAASTDGAVESTPFTLSLNAVFRYSRTQWNKFDFEALAPTSAGYVYEWNFGDGVTSNRNTITHTYNGFGDFNVQLKQTGADGKVSADSTTIWVPFFSLQNRMVTAGVGLLGLLMLVGMAMTMRFHGLHRQAKREEQEADNDASDDAEPPRRFRKVKVRIEN